MNIQSSPKYFCLISLHLVHSSTLLASNRARAVVQLCSGVVIPPEAQVLRVGCRHVAGGRVVGQVLVQDGSVVGQRAGVAWSGGAVVEGEHGLVQYQTHVGALVR